MTIFEAFGAKHLEKPSKPLPKKKTTTQSSVDSTIFNPPNFETVALKPNEVIKSVTHTHQMDENTLSSWLYPTNFPIREYQKSIIQSALFSNTLVALPTGLGKTFIAAVVMFNFYRWFPRGKIVFMAPTKPLVAQQIEACFKITGIPQDDTDEMTGAANPELRRQRWSQKRVFYLTPQVLQNDLKSDSCSSKDVVLLVIDEAHKASGKYSYCEVVKTLTESKTAFRVVALTATPGAENVIDNLRISKIEIRTENSPDIKPYTFERRLDVIVIPPTDKISRLADLFSNVIKIPLDRLLRFKIVQPVDPKNVSKYSLIMARERFREVSNRNPHFQKAAIESDFAILIALSDYMGHLMQLGISMFKSHIDNFVMESNNSKTRSNFVSSDAFQTLLSAIDSITTEPNFVSHPKIGHLMKIVESHFDGASNLNETRIMIFSNFRESVFEIVAALSTMAPKVRVTSFIGQGPGSKKTGIKGTSQKMQLEVTSLRLFQVISKFLAGQFNVMVATCIGEEGLDIGEVDLIICFDAQNSPIRMLQRMGRTGRKREGRVALLLSQGKEEDAHRKSQVQYKNVQKAILGGQGSKLNMFSDHENPLFPIGFQPECVMANLEIPRYEEKKKNIKQPMASAKASIKNSENAFLSYEQELHYESRYIFPDMRDVSHDEQNETLGRHRIWQCSAFKTYSVPNSFCTKNFVQFMHNAEELETEEDSSDILNRSPMHTIEGDNNTSIVKRYLKSQSTQLNRNELANETQINSPTVSVYSFDDDFDSFRFQSQVPPLPAVIKDGIFKKKFSDTSVIKNELFKKKLSDTPAIKNELFKKDAYTPISVTDTSKKTLESVLVPETPLSASSIIQREKSDDVIVIPDTPSFEQIEDPIHSDVRYNWPQNEFCRFKGPEDLPLELTAWPAELFQIGGSKDIRCSDDKHLATAGRLDNDNEMPCFSESVDATKISQMKSLNSDIISPAVLRDKNIVGTPILSQTPIIHRPKKRNFLLSSSPMTNEISEVTSMKKPHLENGLDSMFETISDEEPALDYHNSSTPAHIKLARMRLTKQPRKPPKVRCENTNWESKIPKTKGLKKNILPITGDGRIFIDAEAELSDSNDSGDEIEDGNIDTDLEGFVIGDCDGSFDLPSNTSTPIVSKYHRSYAEKLDMDQNKAVEMFFDRFRNNPRNNRTREREDWEGDLTQIGEGAEAEEFYDDESLADFVVDDDEVSYETSKSELFEKCQSSSPPDSCAKENTGVFKAPFPKGFSVSSKDKSIINSLSVAGIVPPVKKFSLRKPNKK